MKTGGARRKTITSDLPPQRVKNEIGDQVNDQVQSGKRNRRKEQQRRPMNDAENGGNDYDEEENEDVEEEDARSEDKNGGEERPKLAEGFYEIETVRKIRIRKGVKQYLVKWRGWPESANSWEPVESFASCPDVIEAFESMNSGKRKRKRKHAIDSMSKSKKKQKQQHDSHDAAYPMPSVRIKVIEDPCSGPYVNNSNVTENNAGGTSYNETANQLNELEGKLNEINTSSMNQENVTEFAIHIQEDPVGPADGVSNVDGTKVQRVSPRFGARRRKSCAVKRFKNESNSAPRKDDTEKITASSDVIMQDDIRNADDVVNGSDSKNILEAPLSVPVITKIIKPVNYSISIVNDTEDVCVSFLVTRSDGEEIVVDNKYLKENNPVLLINFYEQHLRYTSPSE
ncbi:hypothetical protein SSX86_012916 [Deinandra increscens subsp. villosa]|uniref:Chromo domain-containing protein n=1 Tax=Deinandra increscens subsp. villosa TaxID=3103831 RepID=A0AAP0D527_9ASTR